MRIIGQIFHLLLMSVKNGQEILAKNIRKYRKLQGLTMVQLSVIIYPDGDFYSHLSRIELGKINIKVDTIFLIADALKIDAYLLLKED